MYSYGYPTSDISKNKTREWNYDDYYYSIANRDKSQLLPACKEYEELTHAKCQNSMHEIQWVSSKSERDYVEVLWRMWMVEQYRYFFGTHDANE